VTDDGKYLVIGVSPGDRIEEGLFYKDLSDPQSPVVELLSKFDGQYRFIDNDGPVFWVRSDLDAPRWRLWGIDIRRPQREHWREVIPQTDHALEDVSVIGQRFFCRYLRDATTLVKMHDLDGRALGELALPGLGSAYGFTGKRRDRETFYAFGSFIRPTVIFRYDIAQGRSEVFREPAVPFKPDEYETRQEFYPSKDGTRAPMFISSRKGLRKDGENPTLLYGYGGFGISLTPDFRPATLAWMEMGGVAVTATLRGGGEYGESWHRSGMKLKKQNVFDDFIAAAEHLIERKYTRPQKLAIHGGSNGGLLVGACLNQRPELFGAALPAVGVMDMLRYARFTIGWGWVGELGSPDVAEEFKALYAYSPYHNIREGVCYPPVLITTADHDDRVYPGHSFKYAAALQAAQSKVPDCRNPILIRIETRAGHGAGKPTSKRIDEATDQWVFLVKTLKMSPRDRVNR
jgi:prolyl oligopeptidase